MIRPGSVVQFLHDRYGVICSSEDENDNYVKNVAEGIRIAGVDQGSTCLVLEHTNEVHPSNFNGPMQARTVIVDPAGRRIEIRSSDFVVETTMKVVG